MKDKKERDRLTADHCIACWRARRIFDKAYQRFEDELWDILKNGGDGFNALAMSKNAIQYAFDNENVTKKKDK